ncbi:MAG: helix-turn-helix transcriptional regulator [Proteobacteria bacterium]|nr:helix-turn-helix transcriptional regulator [Pseudomonadota bacterium]
MKLYIKNMVCERCQIVIGSVLQELNLQPRSIVLGEVDLGDVYGELLDPLLLEQLEAKLESYGFELLSSKKSQLIEKIKSLCIEYVQRSIDLERVKLSSYISDRLPHEYNYLSQLFSSVEGTTIEHFYIRQRIEKVKELLVYNELSLGEIAYQLGYSSVAHLSGQFKKVTGLTPSYFRTLKDAGKRRSLDGL